MSRIDEIEAQLAGVDDGNRALALSILTFVHIPWLLERVRGLEGVAKWLAIDFADSFGLDCMGDYDKGCADCADDEICKAVFEARAELAKLEE